MSEHWESSHTVQASIETPPSRSVQGGEWERAEPKAVCTHQGKAFSLHRGSFRVESGRSERFSHSGLQALER